MKNIFIICLAMGAGFLCGPARAQSEPGNTPALSGTATNGQTVILSDKGFEAYYKVKTYIYHGNVRVYNPQMKLTSELLTIERPEMTEGKYDRATAETNVVIDWVDENGTNHATADKVVYTYTLTNHAILPEQRFETNALVVLSGHAYVTNKLGAMRGEPIIWDRIKGVISTPAFQESNFNTTNSAGMFGTDSPKTNHPAK